MVLQGERTPAGKIVLHAYAETLLCKKCGKYYFSRGKHDPGICRECEKETNAKVIGGPVGE